MWLVPLLLGWCKGVKKLPFSLVPALDTPAGWLVAARRQLCLSLLPLSSCTGRSLSPPYPTRHRLALIVQEAEHHPPSCIPCRAPHCPCLLCHAWAVSVSKLWLLQPCSPPASLLCQGVLSLMDLGSCP